MRFFGFTIIRWKNLQAIHARSAQLRQENQKLRDEYRELFMDGLQIGQQLLAAQEQLKRLTTAPGTADDSAEPKGETYAKV